MVSEDPRPGNNGDGPDDEASHQSSEPPTEQIPTYVGTVDDVIEFDDVEFAALTASQPGGGVDRVDLIATREPSDLVRRYLFPTEKFRGEWRRHWIHLVKRVSIGVVATFVLGYVAGYFARADIATGLTVLVIIWIGVMGWVLWDVAE